MALSPIGVQKGFGWVSSLVPSLPSGAPPPGVLYP